MVGQIAEEMKDNERVRKIIKAKIVDRHVKKYVVDYNKPMMENDGKEMLYERDEKGNVRRRPDGKPIVDELTAKDQEEKPREDEINGFNC